jgi:hypothetical protein
MNACETDYPIPWNELFKTAKETEKLREEMCGISPAALGCSYTVWDPINQKSMVFKTKESADAYTQLLTHSSKDDTLATASAVYERQRDAEERRVAAMLPVRRPGAAGLKAWDDLWTEVWKRQVDWMMLASPPAIYVSKEECKALEPYLGVDVAVRQEWNAIEQRQRLELNSAPRDDRVSDEDHMGILALELKQALCPKPEPQEVQPPKRAPRVHGIGTVAAMGHRMGTGFGGDPDL